MHCFRQFLMCWWRTHKIQKIKIIFVGEKQEWKYLNQENPNKLLFHCSNNKYKFIYLFISFWDSNDKEYMGVTANNINISVGNIINDFHAITLRAKIQNMKMKMQNDFKNMMVINMNFFILFLYWYLWV